MLSKRTLCLTQVTYYNSERERLARKRGRGAFIVRALAIGWNNSDRIGVREAPTNKLESEHDICGEDPILVLGSIF